MPLTDKYISLSQHMLTRHVKKLSHPPRGTVTLGVRTSNPMFLTQFFRR